MIENVVYRSRRASTQFRQNRSRLEWLLLFRGILFLSLSLGAIILRSDPEVRFLGWFVYLAGVAAILFRPRWGIYLMLFFALVGDSVLLPWYPFVKNFSSYESIFYLSSALIINPLESYLILTFLSWLIRDAFLRRLHFYKGDLFIPAAVFLVFITFGLIYGIWKGGNVTIALWEVRPFYYLFGMIILSTNLFTKREHYSNLFIWAAAALIIESFVGTYYFFVVLNGSLAGIEEITEHSAAIHINTVFVLIMSAWIYRGSLVKRFALLPWLPFLIITYFAAHRRAAFVSLAVAVILFAILLFFENRKVFWFLVPTVAVISGLYLVAFWNNTGSLGTPAQALKSVVAPTSATIRNQSSNIYRVLENINTSFTIHQHAITGIGFGNKFYLLVPLPDISFFEWWNYLPHNSIIYIWVKSGFGGFMAMLYFIGISILTGTRVVMRVQDREIKILLITGLIYIIMHFLYAYVDISWDAQSMLYIGAVLGILNSAENILSLPDAPAKKQFPWQPEPTSQPGLLPLR